MKYFLLFILDNQFCHIIITFVDKSADKFQNMDKNSIFIFTIIITYYTFQYLLWVIYDAVMDYKKISTHGSFL